MKLVAQLTDNFRDQCLVRDTDRLRGAGLIVFGHRVNGALLTRSGPNFFDVFQETNRFCLQSQHMW